jgi:hypothetical protein
VPSRLPGGLGLFLGFSSGPFPQRPVGHWQATCLRLAFAPHVLRFKLAGSEPESGWDLWPRPRGPIRPGESDPDSNLKSGHGPGFKLDSDSESKPRT